MPGDGTILPAGAARHWESPGAGHPAPRSTQPRVGTALGLAFLQGAVATGALLAAPLPMQSPRTPQKILVHPIKTSYPP